MKIYKIFDPSTGLFSKGGTPFHGPDSKKYMFGKKGKVWTSKQALHLHLSLIRNSRGGANLYRGCVLQEYEVSDPLSYKMEDYLHEQMA